MYIARATWPSSNGKSYESIYLRESYRDGTHVRKRNIANLTHCDPKEIAAIELALRHKNDLPALASLEQIELHQGPSVGAVWTVYQVAKRGDLHHILGENFSGQLALWQVLARVLEQGSRLSAVRLVAVHAAGAVLGWQRGFDENDLYDNLTWLSEQQKTSRIVYLLGEERKSRSCFSTTSPVATSRGITTPSVPTATAGMARRTKNRSSSAYCVTRKENPFPSKSSAATLKIPRPLRRR